MGVGTLTGRRAALFLDRDGVLNHPVLRDGLPYPPENAAHLRIYDDAPPALARAKAMGFTLIVVTNQPDVARGTQTRESVDAINRVLRGRLPIDDVLVCDHDAADACGCRKPLPGLIIEGARRHAVDLSRSFLVGDRWRDIEAGEAAGVTTIMIERGYAEPQPRNDPDARVGSLAEAVDWISNEGLGRHSVA